MDRFSIRAGRSAVVFLATIVIAAGCSSSVQPTVTVVTPTPTASPTATPLPTPKITPSPKPTPTAVPSASASPAASPSDSPTADASASTASCTGSADHQAFYLEAASKLMFDVYCAALPKGWWLQDGEYKQPNGGKLTLIYKNSAGAVIEIGEGNFCSDPSTCWPVDSTIGTGSFGPLSGTLVVASAGPVYGVYVGDHTALSYTIRGKGLTQAKFTAIAAAMVKVAKP
jgi:hypothetical protein